MSIDKVLDYLKENQKKHLDELCDFLRIPSISALSEHRGDIDKAVEFLVTELRALNLEVETIETDGNPLVYAQTAQKEGLPTLLFYGHYDVQPVDPLELWDSSLRAHYQKRYYLCTGRLRRQRPTIQPRKGPRGIHQDRHPHPCQHQAHLRG